MLFKQGHFKSAARLDLAWKIECDALDLSDWDCLAKIAADMVGPFSRVSGVPQGGLMLAEALVPYQSSGASHCLVVDDVWTTGTSMHRHAKTLELVDGAWSGFVVFMRGLSLPSSERARSVQSLFKVNPLAL